MAAHASFSKDSKTVLTPKARKRKNTSLPELQTLSKITAEQSQIERLEDVFQDEIIIAFANITSFKKFARSKNGLCLDQSYINTIVEDHRSNVQEQKLEILFKWQEIQGKKATVPKVRHLLQKYFKKDNPSDYIVLEEGIFGIYKNCFLCERSQVYLGEQISEVTGIQTRAIKLVLKNDKNLREAQILVKLESHVNVVSMIHAGIYHADIADYIYIAMERSWTQTVRNLLKECIILGKPLTEFLAWSLVGQLMKAVKFLHSHNIIHRDLKPENVLASDDWRHFKVTDFGLSKLISDGISTVQTNANIGTEGYRSGETYKQNAKITAKVDVFSAGVTIGEIMANGKHPFGEDPDLWTHNIKTNKNLDLSHVRVFNEGQVIVLIKRMLEMEPEKRPTAKEVLNDVSRLFQMFHLNNQQSSTDESATAKLRSSKARLSITKKVLTGTTADESLATTSKAITEPSITEKVLTGTTADESLTTTSKAKTEKMLTGTTADESLTTTSKAITEEVLTGTIAEADESLASTSKARTELSITEKVLTGTTADEILASTSKAMTELSITEKVNGIIMFDKSDKHMYSFNLSTKEWSRMQVFPEYGSDDSFTTVVSGKHIYFIQCQKVYQLEYSDSAAEWKEMSSTIRKHGRNPPAVVLNGLMYVCGSGDGVRADASRYVERYDAALDRWDRMCDMNTAREYHCVVATEDHIYCIGGRDEHLQSVERFDERLNKWEFVESAPRLIGWATAAVVKNRIYVKGNYDDNKGVLCYDIQNNSWSEIDLTIQWPFLTDWSVKILAVDDELYIIGYICDSRGKRKSAIYLFEPGTRKMTLVEEFVDIGIYVTVCLAVKL